VDGLPHGIQDEFVLLCTDTDKQQSGWTRGMLRSPSMSDLFSAHT